jgi:hypothetical protein
MKSKTTSCGGLGCVAGFLSSALVLDVWWTIAIEVVSLVLFLVSYVMLSE